MDADSSYGGSDTAQDFSGVSHDHPSTTDTSHDTSDVTIITNNETDNKLSVSINLPPVDHSDHHLYKNEISLPVNYDETDLAKDPLNTSPKLPHYLTTTNLNINETLENHSNLEQLNKTYNSTSKLNQESPKSIKKNGVDNPAFQDDKEPQKSTFDEKKPYNNGDLNSSVSLGLKSPTKGDDEMTEAVNLELINMKPMSGDSNGLHENGSTTTTIPIKKETEVDLGDPYDEYFVPVNEHRKYMR